MISNLSERQLKIADKLSDKDSEIVRAYYPNKIDAIKHLQSLKLSLSDAKAIVDRLFEVKGIINEANNISK